MNRLNYYNNSTGISFKIYVVIFLHILIFPLYCSSGIRHCLNFDYNKLSLSDVLGPDGNSYIKISWNSFEVGGIPGSPELPIKYIRLSVPAGANNFDVYITNIGEGIEIPLDSYIFPAQEPLSINEWESGQFTPPNLSIYTNIENECPIQFLDDGYIEGKYHVATIAVCPVRYEATKKKLYVYNDIEFELTYEEPIKNQSKENRNNNAVSYIDINSIVDNQYSSNSIKAVSDPNPNGSEIPKYYYIISEKKLLSPLQELALWKKQKGYTVVLKAIEDIYSEYPINPSGGIADEAASLKSYLQDEFYKHDTFFCLLVGNHNTRIPIRKVRGSNSNSQEDLNPNGQNYIPTDNYFADFETNWDLSKDGSGLFTMALEKSDFMPYIYIGRLLCSTPGEVSNYINKLIIYEANPGYGDNQYLDRARYFVQYDGRNSYETSMESLTTFNDMDKFLDSEITNQGTRSPTGEFAISELGKCGYTSWIAHGEPGTIGCSGKSKETDKWEYISAQDSYQSFREGNSILPKSQTALIRNCLNNGLDLLNNYSKPFVIYAISCNIAPFDIYEESIVYNIPQTMGSGFTTAGRYGGVAFLGNTRAGYFDASTQLEKLFGQYIQIYKKVGIAEAISKYMISPFFSSLGIHKNFARMKVKNTHSLIGEPEFEMWLTSPKTLDLSVRWTDSGISVSGPDIIGCKITVYDGTSVIQTLECNRLISPVFSYPNNTERTMAISIWKSGYLPIISMQCTNQIVKNAIKTFIVRDAIFGKKDSKSDYKVDAGTNLSVKAIDYIKCNEGFTVSSNGKVLFESENSVTLNGGTIEKDGKMYVKGGHTVIRPGFTVEKGAILVVENV